MNVTLKDSPVFRPRLFQLSAELGSDVEVCDAESRFTQVIVVPTFTTRSWWVKFTMSDETPPSLMPSGVGGAAGVGVAVGVRVAGGVGAESGLQAAMAAAVAKSAVRSKAGLRTKACLMK